MVDIEVINKIFLEDLVIRNIEYLKEYLKSSYKDRIPGYYDNSFKLICRNRKYLSVILEGILRVDRNIILEYLRYYDTVLSKSDITKKGGIGDMVVTVNEMPILLECNSSYYKSVVNKNLHTFSGVMYRQYGSGERIDNERRSVMISVDNYDLLKRNRNKLVYRGEIYDKDNDLLITDNLKIIRINLDYVKNILYNKSVDELVNLDEFEKCLALLVITNKEVSKKICEGVDYLMRLMQC